jgi:hypothetical protein
MPLESQRGGDTNVVLRSRVSGHRRKRCGQPLGEDGAQSYGDVWSCEIDGIGCGYGCESSFIREWWTARIRNSDRRDNNNVTQARSVSLSQYKSREWGMTFEYPSYPQFTQYFTVPSSLQPGSYLVYVSDELGKSNEVGVIVVEAK